MHRFGLPRVLPPHPSSCIGVTERLPHPRENSSGYDSSDDDHVLNAQRRARSDPDFRSHQMVNTEPSGIASAIAAYEQHRKENRLKASSEADLVAGESRWDIPRPNTASTAALNKVSPRRMHFSKVHVHGSDR